MALFDLIVNIAANTAELEAGMKRAESTVASFGTAIKGLGIGIAVGEMVRFTEQTLAAGSAMGDAIKLAGGSAESFQRLAYAAGAVGINATTLAASMTRLERNISMAGSGAKTQTEALQALGLTYEELKQLSPEEQFLKIGQQINALKDPTDQSRASVALLGRSFQELSPLLKMAREDIERLQKEAPILSPDQLEALERGNRAIHAMNESLLFMAETALAKVAGPIEHFAKMVGDIGQGKAKEAFGEWMDMLTTSIPGQPIDFRKWSSLYIDQMGKLLGGITGIHGVGNVLESFAAENALHEITGLPARKELPPPGFATDINKLLPGIKQSQIPGKVPLQEFRPGEWGVLEQAAADEAAKAIDRITNERKAGVLTEQQYNEQLTDILTKWHQIGDQLQFVEVHAKRIVPPLNEMQVAANQMVDAFQQAATVALHGGGSLGKIFLQELLRALEDRAIFSAIQQIGDALRVALAGSAEGGTGIFGGIGGAILGGVFGYGGAPVGGGASAAGGIADAMAGTKRAARGAVFAPTYNIDAKGADADRIMTMMPNLLSQSAEKAKRDILDAFHRGGYSAPRSA